MKPVGLLDLLYGERLFSKCCLKGLIIENLNSAYRVYVCEACLKPCDTISEKDVGELVVS